MDAVPDTKPAYDWSAESKVNIAFDRAKIASKKAMTALASASRTLERQAEIDIADVSGYALSRVVDDVQAAIAAVEIHQGLLTARQHLPEAR